MATARLSDDEVVVTLVGGPQDGTEVRVSRGVRLVEVPVEVETPTGGWRIEIGQYDRAMDGRFYWAGVRRRRY
jgi:hypothetical protein